MSNIVFDYLMDTDAVQKAIDRGYNRTYLVGQTWEEFQRSSANNKIIIYGLGNGVLSFIRDYARDLNISCVVDANKAGMSFADFCYIYPEAYIRQDNQKLLSFESLIVEKPEILNQIDIENTSIIIVSLKNYAEIYNMLKKLGVKYCYSYLCMEANKRETSNRFYANPKMEFLYKCQALPIKNIIVVETIGGYCGHGRQVAEKLKEINPNYTFVWIVPNKEYKYHFPEGCTVIRQGTPNYYRVMAMACLWLFEDPITPEFPKKKGQVCVQLKHWASITLKTFGHTLQKGLPNYDEKDDKRLWQYNDEITDCFIVGSEFDEITIREGFLYTHDCFHAGSPRSDLLFDGIDYKLILCKYYKVDYKNKLCLYAPTFRFDHNVDCTYKDTLLDSYSLRKSLESKFGGKWKILLRLHPRVLKENVNIGNLPEFVIDVSTYMDSEELVAASDIMITDYSSIMFEPAFIKKPVFLYAPDLDKYLKEERSFLIDYNTLPFPIAYNNDELIDNISNFSQSEYVKCLDAFFEKYGVHEDGHAAERAAKHIYDLMISR